jgi:hypothetical protein
VVAHARNLRPGDGGLGTEHPGGQGLHGFADFQQPNPYGIEYQAVRQVASLQVGADGIDGCLNVG